MINNNSVKPPFTKKSRALYMVLFLAALCPALAIGAGKEAPAEAAKPGLEAVKKDLKDADHKKRRAAVDALASSSDTSKLDLLKESMNDEDPIIRESSARLIGKSKDKTAFKTLSDALAGADKNSRLGLMAGLGDLGDKKAAKLLAGYLTNEDRNTRWKAAEVLGQLKADEGVDPLLKAAREDSDEFVKKASVASLGRIGTKKAAAALAALKAGKDEKLAVWAENVLKSLAR